MSIAVLSAICGGLATVITAVATAYTSHVVAKYKAQEDEHVQEKEALKRMLKAEQEFSDRLLSRVRELEKIVDQQK
jgi:Na+-translocating ferredoxin:NAD+ oxidoreductase RnfG subunit